MNDDFESKKITLYCEQKLKATPDMVFLVLCPKLERQWITPWNCETVYIDSDFEQIDTVFTTNFHKGETETWIVDRYEPNDLIQYARFSESKVIRLTICLTDNEDGTTDVLWEHCIISLNEKGNIFIQKYAKKAFKKEVARQVDMLYQFLENSKMIGILFEKE